MKNNQTAKTEYLGHCLKTFLVEYLIVTRNLSRNTQMSYRDTFRMLVSFASNMLNIAIDRLKISDLSTDVITKFLDHLEAERNISVSSRNNRLAAIKAFAKYLAWKSPEHIDWCHHVRLIPSKKTEKRMITYMDKKEMNALADAPLRTGKYQHLRNRDHAIILFMYNTGARVSEVIDVKVKYEQCPPNAVCLWLLYTEKAVKSESAHYGRNFGSYSSLSWITSPLMIICFSTDIINP